MLIKFHHQYQREQKNVQTLNLVEDLLGAVQLLCEFEGLYFVNALRNITSRM